MNSFLDFWKSGLLGPWSQRKRQGRAGRAVLLFTGAFRVPGPLEFSPRVEGKYVHGAHGPWLQALRGREEQPGQFYYSHALSGPSRPMEKQQNLGPKSALLKIAFSICEHEHFSGFLEIWPPGPWSHGKG